VRVHLRVGKIDIDWIACFQSAEGGQTDVEVWENSRNETMIARPVIFHDPVVTTKIEAPDGCRDGYQKPMLVSIVQLAEFPERVIPSLVRVEGFDSFLGRRQEARYFSGEMGLIRLGTIKNWKRNRLG